MRKAILVIITTILFITVTIPVAIADYYQWPSAISAFCSVDNMICAFSCLDTTELVHECKYSNESVHTLTVSRQYVCLYCTARGYAPESIMEQKEVNEAHTIVYRCDGGHIDGTNQHKRINECSKCTTFTSTYVCYGPPCEIIWNLPRP